MKLNKQLALVLAVVLLLLTTACGAQATQPAQATPTAQTTPEVTATPAPTATPVPTAAPAEQALDNVVSTVLVKTYDQLLTIELPNKDWAQLNSNEYTEMFSDGDCAIIVNLYKKTDSIPEFVNEDANHDIIYTANVATGDYVMQVIGLAHEQQDFSAIGKAINTIKVDTTRITENMLKHGIVVEEYSIQAVNFTAYVTAESLNVRAASGTDAKILTTLSRDTKVTVVGKVLHNGKEFGWYAIKLNNGTNGYVSANFLTTTQPDSRTGKYITLYTSNGTAVNLYEYSNGVWKTNNGVRYYHEVELAWYDANGNVLYVIKPTQPTKTGKTLNLYNDYGNIVTLYEYTDGSWKNASGTTFYHEVELAWYDSYGNVLYVQNPWSQPYRTGASRTLWTADHCFRIVYQYSDDTWRDSSNIFFWNRGLYWEDDDGFYYYDEEPQNDGEVDGDDEDFHWEVDEPEYIDTDPQPTGRVIYLYPADGGNAVAVYFYDDGSWRDGAGQQYYEEDSYWTNDFADTFYFDPPA